VVWAAVAPGCRGLAGRRVNRRVIPGRNRPACDARHRHEGVHLDRRQPCDA